MARRKSRKKSKTCRTVTVKGKGKRCMCNGKFAKASRCRS